MHFLNIIFRHFGIFFLLIFRLSNFLKSFLNFFFCFLIRFQFNFYELINYPSFHLWINLRPWIDWANFCLGHSRVCSRCARSPGPRPSCFELPQRGLDSSPSRRSLRTEGLALRIFGRSARRISVWIRRAAVPGGIPFCANTGKSPLKHFNPLALVFHYAANLHWIAQGLVLVCLITRKP